MNIPGMSPNILNIHPDLQTARVAPCNGGCGPKICNYCGLEAALHCGNCKGFETPEARAPHYCSLLCAQQDWPNHKESPRLNGKTVGGKLMG